MFSGQSLVLRARPRFVKTLGHHNDREDQVQARGQASVVTVSTDLVPMRSQSQIAINRMFDGAYDVRIYKQPTFRITDFLQVVDSRIRDQITRIRVSSCCPYPRLSSIIPQQKPSIRPIVDGHEFTLPVKQTPLLTQVFKSFLNGLHSIKCLNYDLVKGLPEHRPTVRQSADRLAVTQNHSKGLADKLITASHKIEADNRISLSETQKLKHEFKRVSDEVRELRTILMQSLKQRTEPPVLPAPESRLYDSSWISSSSVTTGAQVLRRDGAIDQRNYVFGLSEMDKGTRIEFKIKELDRNFMESLTFGLTTQQPDCLNISSLEPFGLQLRRNKNPRHWLVAYNALPDPRVGQSVTLERTTDGVIMKREKEEKLLFTASPDVPFYPFLLFDGCISSVQLSKV